MEKRKSKLKINGLESLNVTTSRDEESVINVSLSELYPFKNHPFMVKDDVRMVETVESIKKYGVLTPGIVRPRIGGGYELISGHRRKRACEILGLSTMPVFVRNYTNDQAIVIMVDANIQREDILPSEKAKAYKMKYKALKRQGKKGNGRTLQVMGKEMRESESTMKRYIKLADLTDELLYMVDDGALGIKQGVHLSYLNEMCQSRVADILRQEEIFLSVKQAKMIRESLCEVGESVKNDDIEDVLRGLLKNVIGSVKKPENRNIRIEASVIDEIVTEDISDRELSELVISLLRKWKEEQ